MDVWIRACALPPLSTRAVISLSLSHSLTLSLSLSLGVSLSLPLSLSGKNPSRRRASRRGEESSRRGEEADSFFFFFFFFRYSGGGRIFRKINQKKKKKKDIHPHLLPPPHWCGAAEEEKKNTRMCLRKRSGYRPPDLINAKIVSIWSAAETSVNAGSGAEGSGGEGRCFQFNFPPLWSPVSGGAFPRSAVFRKRSVSVTPSLPSPPSFPPLLSPPLPPSLLSFLTLPGSLWRAGSSRQAGGLWGREESGGPLSCPR